jgi:preprotein translocase subunit SecG
MGVLLRILLAAAGSVAALFAARDAPNFIVIEGMVAVALFAALVLVIALTRKK